MKHYQIVADESVDFSVIRLLRESGISVLAIAEKHSSVTDKEVLKIAVSNKALLLTEDKDFGELVYRFNLQHSGILLIRLIEFDSIEKATLVLLAIQKHYKRLINTFSVLDKRKIRTRRK